MNLATVFTSIEAQPIAPEPEPIMGVRSPYPTVDIGAACIEPMVDEYYRDGAYLWATLELDGELVVEGCEDSATECPAWLDYMLSEECSLAEMVGADYDVLDWSIREGIAPGQPFLIYCTAPWTSKLWTDYGYEYDIEFEAWVVRRLPVEIGPREYERIVNEVLTHS